MYICIYGTEGTGTFSHFKKMEGACVILININQELLSQLRKDNNCWGLAGGFLEMGETLKGTEGQVHCSNFQKIDGHIPVPMSLTKF
jgi:hypothetical protein